jgi:hypothetical protein
MFRVRHRLASLGLQLELRAEKHGWRWAITGQPRPTAHSFESLHLALYPPMPTRPCDTKTLRRGRAPDRAGAVQGAGGALQSKALIFASHLVISTAISESSLISLEIEKPLRGLAEPVIALSDKQAPDPTGFVSDGIHHRTRSARYRRPAPASHCPRLSERSVGVLGTRFWRDVGGVPAVSGPRLASSERESGSCGRRPGDGHAWSARRWSARRGWRGEPLEPWLASQTGMRGRWRGSVGCYLTQSWSRSAPHSGLYS